MLLSRAVYETRNARTIPGESPVQPVQVTQLEERILMSASPAAAAVDAEQAPETVEPRTDAAAASFETINDQQLLDVVAGELPPDIHDSQPTTPIEQTRELVFIDLSLIHI